jgi:hypothetical protein
MDRREFLAVTGAAGAAMSAGLAGGAAAEDAGGCDYYELRQYSFSSEEQAKAFHGPAGGVVLPAYNRAGISPLGAFLPVDNYTPLYVLLRHPSLDSVASLKSKLLSDEEFLKQADAILNVEYTAPTFARIQSSLMVAFASMSHLETPANGADRVFQLRIYESPTLVAAQSKIKMFNTAEIDIFRTCGVNPVFFGETLVGAAMPNLTYMVGFDNADAQAAAWKAFSAHPDWNALKSQPEFAKENLVSNITNIVLRPTPYSQI